MKELIRSTDPVLISFVSALLKEAGIVFTVLDTNMSVMEGSIGVLPQRILVDGESVSRARAMLTEAGVGSDLERDDRS
ncbi:MAG: DUF2007 domain-containing protein [Methyloceanibacter sp.]|jgi:hypothetical protein